MRSLDSVKPIVGTLAAASVLACPASAQNIAFPRASPVDRPVPVRVTDLSPGARLALRTAVADAEGQLWVARAEFQADGSGTVDTGRDPALAGSYTGVETAGLFTHAAPVADSGRFLRFQTAGLPPLRTTIAVESLAGQVLDSVTVERFFIGPGVTVSPVSADGVVGRLYTPGRPDAPGIVVLGGSEGGYPDDVAALLATNGFYALSLAYFATDALPSELREIPLDDIARAIDWLRAQPGVRSDRVGIFGTSKGAEAALLVASRVPGIGAVVAYAPSSVAWSCICSEPALASWTYQGRPVPFVPPGADPSYRAPAGEALRPGVHYTYRLRSAPADAAIPVERIGAPLLLVAGGADQLWPSLPMARAILQRRAAAEDRGDRLLAFAAAGHLIGKAYLPSGSTRIAGGRIETGGSPVENACAQSEAWTAVKEFLDSVLR